MEDEDCNCKNCPECRGVAYDQFSRKQENGRPIWQPIEMGKNIVCDGHLAEKAVAVYTHFHTDHAWNLSRSLSNSTIIMTQVTYDALKVLLNLPERNRSNFEILRYGRDYVTPYEEKVELINANHIPGSAQVLVTQKETDYRVLYSGDFAYPGITVPKTDCLILDPTHGEEIFDFEQNRKEMMERTFEDVLRSIENNHPVEIVAHRGTAQEFMHLFEQSIKGRFIPEMVKFFTKDKLEKELSEVLLNHLPETKNPHEIHVASDFELNDLYSRKQPYIYFSRPNQRPIQQDRHDTFFIDAWTGFKSAGNYVKVNEKFTRVNYQAHSGFGQILKYVKDSEAKEVIVDGSRGNGDTALRLANAISQLGIKCYVSTFKP